MTYHRVLIYSLTIMSKNIHFRKCPCRVALLKFRIFHCLCTTFVPPKLLLGLLLKQS